MAFPKKSTSKPEVKKELETYEELFKRFEKQFPAGTFEYVPSGSIALDYAYGGGFPVGKVTIISALPGLGKSLISLYVAKAILKADPENIVLYLDVEDGIVDSLKEAVLQEDFGVRFVHKSPKTYEDAEQIINDYAKPGKLKAVFIDSVTALQPKAVLEEGSMKIGAKSGAEATFCVKMKIVAATYKFGVLYVNQIRANIDTKGGGQGSPTKAAGGWALRFNNDAELIMRPKYFIYDAKKNRIGACVEVYCEKNRFVGNRSAYMFLKYGFGISNLATMVDVLKFHKMAKQGGSYFSMMHPDFDFGEGKGVEKKVLGNQGLEDLVKLHFDALYKLAVEHDLITEYFKNAVI